MSGKAGGGEDGGREDPDARLLVGRGRGVAVDSGLRDADRCRFAPRVGVFAAGDDDYIVFQENILNKKAVNIP